jgi:hypothetical protein
MPVYEFKCPRHGTFSKTADSDTLVARCKLCQRPAPRVSEKPANEKSKPATSRAKLDTVLVIKLFHN